MPTSQGYVSNDITSVLTPFIHLPGQTFTPTVTLVGGAANTVPQYTTNTGNYSRLSDRVYVEIYLNGNTGNAGAGTGQINIALPIAANANYPAITIPCGYALNLATYGMLYGSISGGGTTIALNYFSTISVLSTFTGVLQNNATRTISLAFFYQV